VRLHQLCRRFILADDLETPVVCPDLESFALFFEETDKRVVENTIVGDRRVSTVFLCFDHNWSDQGPPILWETMVFGGDGDTFRQQRYATKKDALAGHWAIVEEMKLLPAGKLRRLTSLEESDA
jgi:hypothetical protein